MLRLCNPSRHFLIAIAVLQCAIELQAVGPPVTDIAFAPEGKTLVAVSQIGIQEYSWPALKLLRTFKSEAANLHCLAFSPNGKLMAVGGGNPSEVGIVEVFSWPDGKRVAEYSEDDDSVMSVAWLDEKRFLSASLDRMIHLRELENADSNVRFSGHSRGVSGLCVVDNQSAFVSVGHDQSVRVWNLETNELIRSLSQHTGPIQCVALRPSQPGLPMIATAASDRTIRFWQPTIGRMVRFARLQADPLKIAWTKNGDRVLAGCVDGQLRVIDPVEVKVVREIAVGDSWLYALAVHPSDGSVAVGGADTQIRRIEVSESSKTETQSNVR